MPRPTDDPRDLERRFFDELATRRTIRISARALVIQDGYVLLQKPAHHDSNRFFPGGELEFGEALEEGLRRELTEETSLEVRDIAYRFTANNRFQRAGVDFHLLEHYFEVHPTSFEVESLEEHVLLEWLRIDAIALLDIRPWGVRDILGQPDWRGIRLIEVG